MGNDVRGLSAAEYLAAKRRLLSGAPAVAPVNLADRLDDQCIDVRGLSEQGYRAAKAGLLQRTTHTTRKEPAP